jgi:hypothetical protein
MCGRYTRRSPPRAVAPAVTGPPFPVAPAVTTTTPSKPPSRAAGRPPRRGPLSATAGRPAGEFRGPARAPLPGPAGGRLGPRPSRPSSGTRRAFLQARPERFRGAPRGAVAGTNDAPVTSRKIARDLMRAVAGTNRRADVRPACENEPWWPTGGRRGHPGAAFRIDCGCCGAGRVAGRPDAAAAAAERRW